MALSIRSRRGRARPNDGQTPTVRDMLIHTKPVGPVSLQHHGAAVWFKNLKIRPL